MSGCLARWPGGNSPSFYRAADRCAAAAGLPAPLSGRGTLSDPTFSAAATVPAWENLGPASKKAPSVRPCGAVDRGAPGSPRRASRPRRGKHQLTAPVPRRVPLFPLAPRLAGRPPRGHPLCPPHPSRPPRLLHPSPRPLPVAGSSESLSSSHVTCHVMRDGGCRVTHDGLTGLLTGRRRARLFEAREWTRFVWM